MFRLKAGDFSGFSSTGNSFICERLQPLEEDFRRCEASASLAGKDATTEAIAPQSDVVVFAPDDSRLTFGRRSACPNNVFFSARAATQLQLEKRPQTAQEVRPVLAFFFRALAMGSRFFQ
jgi:hypothetical protein